MSLPLSFRPILAGVILASFTLGAVLPERAHGCARDAEHGGAREAGVAGDQAHHAAHHGDVPPAEEECRCIDTACCAAPARLVARTGIHLVAAGVGVAATAPAPLVDRASIRPPYLLPLAQAPPAQTPA
jgi:hypothetical protein